MPKSVRGFTLVELLVVITIIAILAVIGITIFTGVQKGARDAKRRGDIDAIAKALEVNKTSAVYQAVQGSWFTQGTIPPDPKGFVTGCGNSSATDEYGNKCWYCIKAQDASASAGYCTASDHHITNSTPFDSYAKTAWVICANLETGSPAYYCRANQQ